MGVILSFGEDGKPIVKPLDLGKNKKGVAYIENGKIVVGMLTVYDGCIACPYSIVTSDSLHERCDVYCSLKKEEHPECGSETDKKKMFEYHFPSEKKKFQNFIPEECPLRGKKK